METQVGTVIRGIRKERKLTLTMLSERTGLSVGFLSNLERNETSPTVANLHKICEALGITFNDILASTEEDKAEAPARSLPFVLVRKDDRPTLFDQGEQGIRYESMTTAAATLKSTAMTLSGKDWVYFSPHDHDELGIVASGSMEMAIGEDAVILHEGDCIFIPAWTMHSGHALNEAPCTSYWIKHCAPQH